MAQDNNATLKAVYVLRLGNGRHSNNKIGIFWYNFLLNIKLFILIKLIIFYYLLKYSTEEMLLLLLVRDESE